MNNVAFDPDSRAEFLAAIEYYEECEAGLGRRFRELVRAEMRATPAVIRLRLATARQSTALHRPLGEWWLPVGTTLRVAGESSRPTYSYTHGYRSKSNPEPPDDERE